MKLRTPRLSGRGILLSNQDSLIAGGSVFDIMEVLDTSLNTVYEYSGSRSPSNDSIVKEFLRVNETTFVLITLFDDVIFTFNL